MNAIFAVASVVLKELYRRKDFYVLFVLTVMMTLIMASANIFNDDRISRYLKEMCLLMIWVSALIMAVATAARQIPAERENRTIFPLLAKPVTRAQVIAGKFLGCWLACGLCLVVFYLFLGIVSASRDHEWPVLNYFEALWMQWIFLAVVIAAVLFGSIIFAAPSTNATLCLIFVLGILLLGRQLSPLALREREPLRMLILMLYFLLPHLEWFDVRDLVLHNQGLVSGMDCGLATVYGVSYAAFFLVAAWICFRRRALNQ
jgi:ABC-type transport system involved in multi-copper enzyme maturation permease subunit